MNDELMKRPSNSDEYVRRRAAELALPEVMGWLRRDKNDRTPESEVIDDLMKIMCDHSDGYQLAKELEDRHGWSVDAGLVDILNNDHCNDAIRELTKKWVLCLGIKPAFAIGASVTTDRIMRKGQIGTILSIDTELAEYGIQFPDQKDGWRTVVPFENVHSAA